MSLVCSVCLTTRSLVTVSYTHLDVYKRQVYGYGTNKGKDIGRTKLLILTSWTVRDVAHRGIEFCCCLTERQLNIVAITKLKGTACVEVYMLLCSVFLAEYESLFWSGNSGRPEMFTDSVYAPEFIDPVFRSRQRRYIFS